MDEPFCARLEVITPHFIVYLFKETNCLACSCIKRMRCFVSSLLFSDFYFYFSPSAIHRHATPHHRSVRRSNLVVGTVRAAAAATDAKCTRSRTFTHDMKTKRFKGIVFRLFQITFSLVLLYRWRPPLPFGFRAATVLRSTHRTKCKSMVRTESVFFSFSLCYFLFHWKTFNFTLKIVCNSLSVLFSIRLATDGSSHECAWAFVENLFFQQRI